MSSAQYIYSADLGLVIPDLNWRYWN